MAVRVTKVSVALGTSELEWARKQAAREGTSVSAIVTAAVAAARRAAAEVAKGEAKRKKGVSELLAFLAEGGSPLTQAEKDAAWKELTGEAESRAPRARPRRRAA